MKDINMRIPKCGRCSNHLKDPPDKKGHKHMCPFQKCNCKKCKWSVKRKWVRNEEKKLKNEDLSDKLSASNQDLIKHIKHIYPKVVNKLFEDKIDLNSIGQRLIILIYKTLKETTSQRIVDRIIQVSAQLTEKVTCPPSFSMTLPCTSKMADISDYPCDNNKNNDNLMRHSYHSELSNVNHLKPEVIDLSKSNTEANKISYQESINGKKVKNPKCARCRNHGKVSVLKGHKRRCEFKECRCRACKLTLVNQEIMAKSISEKRKTKEDIDNGTFVDTQPVIRKKSRTDECLFETDKDSGYNTEDNVNTNQTEGVPEEELIKHAKEVYLKFIENKLLGEMASYEDIIRSFLMFYCHLNSKENLTTNTIINRIIEVLPEKTIWKPYEDPNTSLFGYLQTNGLNLQSQHYYNHFKFNLNSSI